MPGRGRARCAASRRKRAMPVHWGNRNWHPLLPDTLRRMADDGVRRALVVTQVALSLVLVVGAVLFSRSFQKLITDNAGFKQSGLLLADIDFASLPIPRDQRLDYGRNILQRLRAIPGATGVAQTAIVPLRGSGWNNFVWMEGVPKEKKSLTWMSRVSDGYFATLGIPILAGRDFDERDTAKSPAVAIVTEAFARQFLNGRNPVGMRFLHEGENEDNSDKTFEIIGLVRDMKYNNIRRDMAPIIFYPQAQEPQPRPGMQVLIRGAVPLAEISAAVKRVLNEVNPAVSVEFQVYEQLVRSRLLRERIIFVTGQVEDHMASVIIAQLLGEKPQPLLHQRQAVARRHRARGIDQHSRP